MAAGATYRHIGLGLKLYATVSYCYSRTYSVLRTSFRAYNHDARLPSNLTDSTVVVDDSAPVSTVLSRVGIQIEDNLYESLVQRMLQAETYAQSTLSESLFVEEETVEVNNDPDVLLMSHDAAGTPIILGTVSTTINKYLFAYD